MLRAWRTKRLTKKLTKQKIAKLKSTRKQFLKPSDPIPEDIHWEWLEVIKAAQAACKDNSGFAKLTLVISVHLNKPILWSPRGIDPVEQNEVESPKYNLLQLSPKRIAEYKMSAKVVASLIAVND